MLAKKEIFYFNSVINKHGNLNFSVATWCSLFRNWRPDLHVGLYKWYVDRNGLGLFLLDWFLFFFRCVTLCFVGNFFVLLSVFLLLLIYFWILLGLENSSGKDEASLIGITQAQGSFSLKGKLFEPSLSMLHCFQE